MKTELEEAAERYRQFWLKNKITINQIFEAGYKLAQERMYSEEEVEIIAKDAYEIGRKSLLIGVFNQWFEQFKKKTQ